MVELISSVDKGSTVLEFMLCFVKIHQLSGQKLSYVEMYR